MKPVLIRRQLHLLTLKAKTSTQRRPNRSEFDLRANTYSLATESPKSLADR
jgi:hypothetical protein